VLAAKTHCAGYETFTRNVERKPSDEASAHAKWNVAFPPMKTAEMVQRKLPNPCIPKDPNEICLKRVKQKSRNWKQPTPKSATHPAHWLRTLNAASAADPTESATTWQMLSYAASSTKFAVHGTSRVSKPSCRYRKAVLDAPNMMT
jgi:hypothetical protein